MVLGMFWEKELDYNPQSLRLECLPAEVLYDVFSLHKNKEKISAYPRHIYIAYNTNMHVQEVFMSHGVAVLASVALCGEKEHSM